MHKLIRAMEPQRDQRGFWTHPNYFVPSNGMEYAAPGEFQAWQDANRVTARVLWMESDVTDEQINQAMVEKLAINKTRSWLEPKDGEPRLHIKGES